MTELNRRIMLGSGAITVPMVEMNTQLSEHVTGVSLSDIANHTITAIPAFWDVCGLFFIYLLLGIAGALGAYLFTNLIVPIVKKWLGKLKNRWGIKG